MRDRGHGAPVGPWRVQKKSDRPADLQPAHFCAQGEKVIVLNPEDRVRAGEAQQRAGHERVDFAI